MSPLELESRTQSLFLCYLSVLTVNVLPLKLDMMDYSKFISNSYKAFDEEGSLVPRKLNEFSMEKAK